VDGTPFSEAKRGADKVSHFRREYLVICEYPMGESMFLLGNTPFNGNVAHLSRGIEHTRNSSGWMAHWPWMRRS